MPKTHKPRDEHNNLKFRPIVNSTDTFDRPVASAVARKLAPLLPRMKTYVKNSADFSNKIANMQLEADEIMLSLDVENLYTNVSIEKAIEAMRDKLEENPDILIPKEGTGDAMTIDSLDRLVKLCLSYSIFSFNEAIFRQIKGLAMGSPLSPTLANLFMSVLEDRLIRSCPVQIGHFWRYVDDCFVIIKRGQNNENLTLMLEHFNNGDPDIKFTMEVEEEGKIPFLDVLITRQGDGVLKTTVYRKPTHSGRGINFRSFHHPATKVGVVKTLTTRAMRNTSKENDLDEELNQLKREFIMNGFPGKLVERAIRERRTRAPRARDRLEERKKPFIVLPYQGGVSDKLTRLAKKFGVRVVNKTMPPLRGRLVHNQDKTEKLDTIGVVYKLQCCCGMIYIGETKRKLRERVKEHCRDFENKKEGSPFWEHAQGPAYPGQHGVDQDSAAILKVAKTTRERKTQEALFINACLSTGLLINQKHEIGKLRSPFWNKECMESIQKLVLKT